MKEKIIALYIRLSVEDRDLDELKTASVSIQNQKVHLRNFLMCHPETASGEIREFIDDGYTGTNMDRPAFQEMMKLAREEQISCIVVKDFSRFGRNYLEVGNYLEQIFPLLGIRFISVDDKSSDSMDIHSSGFQMLRHRSRMFPVKAVDTASAYLQRTNLHSRTHIKSTGSLGSQKSLMPGKAKDIYSLFLYIHR